MRTIGELFQNTDYPHVHEALYKGFPDEFKSIQAGDYQRLMEDLLKSKPISSDETRSLVFDLQAEVKIGFTLFGRKNQLYPLERLNTAEMMGLSVDGLEENPDVLIAHVLVEWKKQEKLIGAEHISCVEPNQHLPYFRKNEGEK